ncbi:RsmB/NOP family class I SAM-dependent RNA methyltransferase [Acidisoma cladoniae]|uniref:RsmB/NOP family class I SAM-dependent RNA methyltransferase n=1 Tax=Acidisoma cladoniae TaxID=3040935 RepID=UPI0025512CBF|nr:RsmB/NOP family class I SAM-dependent RNA methyltransferase [Acidisoma sp. PAMC 29798]
MTPNARLAAAIDLLQAIEAAPRKPADAVANDYFRARRFIGGGDRREVSDQVWSVLRHQRRLSWWVEHAQGVPSPRMTIAALAVLTGRPSYQVVNMYSGGRYAPEPMTSEEEEILRRLNDHTLDHPQMPDAVRLEVPDWIMPLLTERFGRDTDREVSAMLAPAPLDLRVNLLKGDRTGAIAALAAEGIVAEPTTLSPWGLRIAGRRPVVTGEAFKSGLVEIQDEGSQVVALLADAQPGMRIADYCAGAGGKTLAMAMTMENKGQILAADTSAHRLDGAVRRLRRAGVHNVEQHLLTTGDKWAKRRRETFDRVLVDAPCTGTGTWRRNPDARLRLTPSDLEQLVEKQAIILHDASRLLRKGGQLIYATCSLLRPENEDQVARFLADHPDFTLIDHPPHAPAEADMAGGTLRLTPARHGTDGFFAAVMEKR